MQMYTGFLVRLIEIYNMTDGFIRQRTYLLH